ncbi:substrate-binding periplasmic protein [Pseudobacteriovorax antillogorgiicola]|uniref:substrate-binding periplasmic protein n=1 Tax=Pseudobacteriovorax antillogorgiicola TaxID=1513793 RepID=UPI001F3FF242|nr:transporter substrate-binding domain-containing protein [Pseudobacteriovorax antillogorgiicola]
MRLFCSVLAILGFSSFTQPLHASKQPIIINDSKWPPFFYGVTELKGLGKEVLHSCLDNMGIPHKFKFHPIKRMRVMMEKGLIDINIYSHKKSREKFLYYGQEPLFVSSYNPIVLKGSGIKINKISDFDKHRLGHQIGLRYSIEYHDYIKKRQKDRSLDEANSIESNLRKLLQKRIDVFVATKSSALLVAKEMGMQDKIEALDYAVQLSKYYVALSRKTSRVTNPKEFLKKVDSCIKNKKNNKEYCKITSKYSLPCSI